MHEFSIAEHLLRLIEQHLPEQATLRSALVRVGPLRGIEPDSMLLAWSVLTRNSPHTGARLRLEELPNGDDLKLVSIDVEEALPCK